MSRLVTLLCLAALAVLPAAGVVGTGEDVATAGRLRPNVLIIITDDQSRGTLTRAAMPNTFHALRQGGRRYARFFITDPLCCPSRAAIMTGRLNHNNGVRGNTVGSFHLDMGSTLQHYLHQAGYQTWISGKFLNAWSYDTAPPDWDRFTVTKGGRHIRLGFNQDGRQVYLPGQADPYIARQAHRYLAATERHDGQPWFGYLALTVPHQPYSAAPGYGSLPVKIRRSTPSELERDISDKLPLYRRRAAPAGSGLTEWEWAAQLRMLRQADDIIGGLLRQLRDQHEQRCTIVVFLSDNGYLFGAHRLHGSGCPTPRLYRYRR